MRIRGLDEETEEAMEDFDILQGKIADLTKTADKPGGISLFKDKEKTQYKSTYEILKEISEIYHDLTDKEQAGLLEALAGKRGGQVLAGLLDDFSEVERAMTEISQSAGSADDEMKIVSESITFKLNALKQTWVDFLTDIINRESTGKLIDNLTTISEKIIELLEANPGAGLAGIATGITLIGKALNGKLISNIASLINNFALFKTLGVGGGIAGSLAKSVAPITTAVQGLKNAAPVITESTKIVDSTALAYQNMGLAAEGATTGLAASSAALEGAEVGAVGLTGALSTLLPILAAIAGVVIVGLAWDELTTTVKEAEQALSDTGDRIETVKSEIEELENIDYRNPSQQARLDQLREELDLLEQIYEADQRRVLEEKYGNKFSDLVGDPDNYNSKLTKDKSHNRTKGSGSQLLDRNTKQAQEVKALEDQIASYKNTLSKLINGELQENLELGITEDRVRTLLSESERRLVDVQGDIADNNTKILDKIREYETDIEQMESDIKLMRSGKAGQFTKQQILEKEKIRDSYVDYVNELRAAVGESAHQIQMDFSEELSSLFEQEEFAEVKDELVQLGKDGELSVDVLTKRFSNLLKKVQDTGASAEDLYYFIMNLSDPNRLEKDKFVSNWMPTGSGTLGDYQYQQYTKIRQYLDTLDDEQLQILFDAEVDWDSLDYEAFKEKAEELLSPVEVEVELESKPKQFSNQDFSEKLTTKLADLQKSYDSFITDVQNGEQKAMDLDSLESMRKDLVKTEEQLGVTAEQFKAFEDVVGNSESTAQEMQDAYDTLGTQLANVYFDKAAEETGNLDDKTKQLIKDQLILKGFTEESVDAYVEYKAAIKSVAETFHEESEARKAMSEADKAEEEAQAKRLNQMIQKELATAPTNATFSPERLEGYKEQVNELKTYLNDELHEAYRLGVDLDQTIYGNIDTNTRQILRWTDENIEKYKDAILSSIKDIDEWTPEQINEFLDNEYRGAYSTVDADMADFHTVTGQSIPIAFTPMLQTTEDGTGQPIYLDSNTLNSYLQAVVTQAGTDLSAENILRIDSEGIEGFEAEGIKIKNLIAGIGNEAEKANVSMHFTGVHGSINETRSSLEGLNSSLEAYEKQMSEAGHSNEEMAETAERIKELREELEQIESEQAFVDFATQADADLAKFAEDLGITSDALVQFTAQMMIANGTDLNSQESVAQLQQLMSSSGLTTEVITKLIRVMEIYQTIASGVLGTNTQAVAMAKQEVQTILNEIATLEKDGLAIQNNMEFDPTRPKTKNTGGGGSSKGKTLSEQFEEELKKLKEQYERGELTLSEYLAQYRALIDKYFDDTEKNAEARAKALHDYLAELKGYYDSAISGVTTLIDHRIKAVQKQKDVAIKAIEAERDAALKAYDDQIKAIDKIIKEKNKQIKAIEKQKKELEKQKKPLQDEIDAIQKAAEERERNLKAQKDLYELERAQLQRTQFIYKNGQMVYQQDTDSIRNAKQEVDKDKEDARIAKLNKQIDAIQKQEDLLDEQIELIQEEIDALEEQKELLEEQKAEVEEFYNNLIEETTAAFDAIIEQLEATKSKWEELAEIDKVASAWKDVGGIMEALGFTVEDVLNDTPGAFEAFKDAYVATLSGLNGGNEQYLQGLSEVTGKTVEELKAMGDGVANISKDTQQPMADIADSVEKLGTNSSTASGHVSSLGSSVSTTTSNVNELNTSTKTANENLNATNKISLDAVKQQVDNLKDSAEKLRQELDGTNSGGKTIKDLLEDINQVTFTGIIENLSGLSQEVGKIAKSITEGLAKALEADTTAQEAAKKLGQRVVGDEKGTGLGAGVEQGSPSESAKRVAQSIPDGIKEILDTDTTAEDAAETLGKDTVKALGDSIEADLNAMQIDFSTIFGDTDFSLLAQQFNDLGLAIQTVADALGMGQDASVGGLFQAISDLNSIDLGVESGAGVIGQFNALKTAIDSVSSAIGSAGGGEGESGGFVGNTNAQVSAMQSAGGGSGSSLSSSIEGLKSTAETAIGTEVAGEGAEGDGTVIGDFGALTTSISNATTAIGTTESESDAKDLIGSIASLNEKSQEYMVADSDAAGDDGIVPRFNKLNEVIAEAEGHISGIEDGLKAIDELEEVECTIKINIETSGDMPTFSFRMTGSAMPWEGMNLESGEYIAKYATGTAYPHQYGTANVKGNWGVQQPGKSLVGELGQEVIIRDGRFWTVGDNGPEFVNLQKDDIVLNHLQTREILSKKNLIKPKGASGRAYANGTLPNGLTPLSLADPEQFARFMQLADALKTNTEDMRVDLSDLSTMARDIERSITNTTYNNSNRNANITFGDLNFTCTGITSADVLSEVGSALEKEFSGIALNAYKKAMAH